MTKVKFGCVAIDCPDPHATAEFYGQVLGWPIHAGHKPGDRWVQLTNPGGAPDICFQRDPDYRPPTWPSNERPQMMHLDFDVPDIDAEHDRVVALGARQLHDEPGDFRVYADPDGRPFCLSA